MIRPVGFLSDIKKPYTTCKALCFIDYRYALTARLIVLVGFMSKEWMKIGSVGTFNDGSLGPIGGLRNRLIDTGGFNRIWLFVLKQLRI